MTAAVYAVGTMDTKGEELAYVKDCHGAVGIKAKMVDVGTQLPPTLTPDVTREEVVAIRPEASTQTGLPTMLPNSPT